MQENKNLKKPKQFNPAGRVKFVFILALLVTIGFVFRLFYLQILAADEFKENAYAQRRSDHEIMPERGNIYDRENRPLAVSVKVNNCYLSAGQIKEEDREETAELLSYILSIDKETIMQVLSSKRAYVAIKRKLSQEEIKQIKSSGLVGVSIEREAERYYPHNDLMAQTLGIVNQEGRGIYGLESTYDYLLKGQTGRSRYSRDIRGNIIPTEDAEVFDSVAGQNIQLTVDLRAQKIVQEEIKKGTNDFQADACSAILMDPNTGEILAIDHYPSFNANNPRAPISVDSDQKWEDLNSDQQLEKLYDRWKNPIVSQLYEPGSVFKILSSAISLESGANKDTSTYTCNGTMELAPGVSISCWRTDPPHGVQNLEQALNNSCNPAFVQIVREMGYDTFYSYLRSLRMGSVTGIDLPGETASILDPDKENIDKIKFDTMSYGYGISLTPLQMITAANTVINGGCYRKPHIFKQSSNNQGQVLSTYMEDKSDPIFSQSTVDTMRQYLYSTSSHNHAKIMRIEGMKIGSKSGTAHMLDEGKYTNKTMASFYSFYPVDNPQYALLVVSQNPKTDIFGGVVSGEISARIIEKLLQKEETTSEGDEGLNLPDFKGKTVAEAINEIQSLSLKVSLYGGMNPFSVIGDQEPAAGLILKKGDEVKLLPDEDNSILVPDLMHMTREELEAFISRTGLRVKISGPGNKVASQNIEAGEKLPGNREIIVEMSEEESETSSE